MKNKQHPCRHARVENDGAASNSTHFTNLVVDGISIAIENTGDDESWIYGNNERHNKIINNMVRSVLLDNNQHEKKGVVQQKHKLKYIDSNYAVN